MRPFRTCTALGLGLALAAPAAAALAQTAADDRPALLKSLADCRKLTDDRARLACYDAAAGALDQAEAKGEIVVVDRERANKVRRQAFGFSLPSLSILDRPSRAPGSDKPPEPLDRLTATLARGYQRGDGKWVLELDDGAVWVQTDSQPLGRGAKKGAKVEIRRAALGSFFVNVDEQRAIRASRVR